MTHTDVVILGGGLAGLSLSLQLKQRFADLDVVVLERRRHPAPDAIHKVGESTVEIAANYFDTVLGLKDHLAQAQLKKYGYRFFFCEGSRDISRAMELGASTYLPTPGYQIDRGIFENFLGGRVRDAGVRFLEGSTVRGIELGEGGAPHRVRCEADGQEKVVQARWLVDASGRAGLLKRHLGLALDNEHDVNSVWFRIGARIDVNDWSSDPDWLGRCNPPSRWLSTNHLVGEGYWVWLIPLASGSHSVGIVADARIHPLERMNTFERALAWLRQFQPRLAEDVESKRDRLQDFVFLKRFSYGCRKVFSGDRWALTGESGVFPDPFYSPGSDFIAIANTYITELIGHDRAGRPVNAYARIYDQFFMSFYDSTMSLYRNQYRIFGDPEVLPVKVIWDYTYYWGVLCQLFFQRRLADVTLLARLRDELNGSKALNFAMQDFLREWSARSRKRSRAVMLDQVRLDWFVELNRGLRDPLDDAGFVTRMRETTLQLRQLAGEIVVAARADYPELDASGVEALLGNARDAVSAGMLFDSAA
jgi:flavin-dependent dehydrogenase